MKYHTSLLLSFDLCYRHPGHFVKEEMARCNRCNLVDGERGRRTIVDRLNFLIDEKVIVDREPWRFVYLDYVATSF